MDSIVRILVLGGDFNGPFQPLLDTSPGTSSLLYKAIRCIKLLLQNLLVHHIWRTLNPGTQDYTYFSTPHNRHSRLEYFFLFQTDLHFLSKCTIEPIILWDHNPITMTLTFPEHVSRSNHWRLSASLLTDTAQLSQIFSCLQTYFRENADPAISPITIWKAHKCVIRVEPIAVAARRRKEKQAHVEDLMKLIQTPEATHKQTWVTQMLQELISVRKKLLYELKWIVRRKYILTKKTYEHGNKSRKLFSWALQSKKAAITIWHIQSSEGKILASHRG